MAQLADLLYPGFGNPLEGVRWDEDCLALNVWTPGVEGPGRPVVVWLHGGGYQDGSASNLYAQGDRLVERESLVLISVNHRLGVLGYTALGDIAGERFDGSGLAGILDLILALEWVQANAAAFGGDPNNVTIVGQSGGGFKVATLLSMPVAGRLFHKAVVQSGPALRVSDRSRGEREGRALLDAFGLTPRRASELRDVPAGALLDYQRQLLGARRPVGDRGLSIQPAQDGIDLPSEEVYPWNPAVPVLVGTTADENAFWLMADAAYQTDMTASEARGLLATRPSELPSTVYDLYAGLLPGIPPHRVLARIVSEEVFRGPALRLANRVASCGAAAYVYVFGYETGVLDRLLGACHASDLPFTFSTANRIPLAGIGMHTGAVEVTTGRVLASFARNGSPDAGDGQAWPPHHNKAPAGMWLDVACRPLGPPDYEGLSALDGVISTLCD